ncbi:S41 family peptidase [Actinokineospora sp.]|uniref:S41 family peptidase n=1 Tax=Actinokineospora sp. TaxID=1872133 RepID=UPI003D6ACED3
MTAGYFRWPDIRGDRIVFVCADDLWTAPVAGGQATRLTEGAIQARTPRFNHDGTAVAYGRAVGAAVEVEVLPADGGVPRRLTFEGVPGVVASWHPRSGEVLYASSAGEPFPVDRLRSVDPAGGLSREFDAIRAGAVAFGPGGLVVVRTGLGDPAYRKRYRGGAAGMLWIGKEGGGFRPLTAVAGNVDSPCWIGDRVYFLSDHGGTAEIYSCEPDGGDLRSETDHGGGHARALSGDGTRLVYQFEGSIRLFEPDSRHTSTVDIRLPGISLPEQKVPALGNLRSVDLSPDGRRVAITVRGKALTLAARGGDVQRHGSDKRYRLLSWLDDRRLVAVASPGRDPEQLVIFDAGAECVLPVGDLGIVAELRVCPRGEWVAVANSRYELFAVSVSDGRSTLITRGEHDRPRDLAWSPDGRWLAYSMPESPDRAAIWAVDIVSGRSGRITSPLSRDRGPAFAADGRFLYFLGVRDLTAEGADDLAVRGVAMPYAVELCPGESASDRTRVDFTGIEDRARPLTAPRTEHRQVVATPAGLLLVRGGPGDTMVVSEQGASVRADQVAVSRDGRTVLYLDRGSPRVASRDQPVPLDLDGVDVSVSPRAEWRQMFGEAWRLQREHVWDAGRVGAAWDAAWDRYAPLLDRVHTRAELSDLIGELHGELSASHAGERLPRTVTERQGFLGLVGEPGERGFLVTAVPAGSPCAGFDVAVNAGDVIERIDGVPTGVGGLGPALAGKGGRVVEVGLRGRIVRVRALDSERAFHHAAWCADNRRRVRAATDGRVGYLHLPDLGACGYARFREAMLTEGTLDGLVIDVRGNEGGHASWLVVEHLARRRRGARVPRRGQPRTWPPRAVDGPMAVVADEYTGSDGEVFCEAFRLAGLGPVVGVRTWGGGVGIRPRHALADGTVTTQPEFRYDIGSARIEDHGVDPDHVVLAAAHDDPACADPQLDRAVALVLDGLDGSGQSGFPECRFCYGEFRRSASEGDR